MPAFADLPAETRVMIWKHRILDDYFTSPALAARTYQQLPHYIEGRLLADFYAHGFVPGGQAYSSKSPDARALLDVSKTAREEFVRLTAERLFCFMQNEWGRWRHRRWFILRDRSQSLVRRITHVALSLIPAMIGAPTGEGRSPMGKTLRRTMPNLQAVFFAMGDLRPSSQPWVEWLPTDVFPYQQMREFEDLKDLSLLIWRERRTGGAEGAEGWYEGVVVKLGKAARSKLGEIDAEWTSEFSIKDWDKARAEELTALLKSDARRTLYFR